MKLNTKNSLIILAMTLATSTSAFAFNSHSTGLDAKCSDVTKQYKVRAVIKNTYNGEERDERYKVTLKNFKKDLNQEREGGLYYSVNATNELKLRLNTPNKLDRDNPIYIYKTTGDGVVTFRDNDGILKEVSVTCNYKWDDRFSFSNQRDTEYTYQFGYNDN